MADDTDTTRPGEAEAVEKGLEVLGPWPRSLERQMARVTVDLLIDAVYPVIAAAVRDQAAQDIEAEGRASPPFAWVGDGGWTAGLKEGYKRSVEIVRGGR